MRVHRAWWVAAVTFLVLLSSAAFRSSIGVMLEPIESDLGWTRTQTSLAASVNLIVYGLTAPFAAALMEHLGVRRVAVAALALIAGGSILTVAMSQPWHLYVLWGILIGLGTGSVALVFGSIVVNRWFVAHRGLVLGILGSAWATGQVFFLPLLARVTQGAGWPTASAVIAIGALALIPRVLLVLRDRPGAVGLAPRGASPDCKDDAADQRPTTASAALGSAVRTLAEVATSRAFLLLFAAHMVGGGIAAIASGVLRSSQGDYVAAWLLAGALAVLAAGASTLIPRAGGRSPEPVTAGT